MKIIDDKRINLEALTLAGKQQIDLTLGITVLSNDGVQDSVQLVVTDKMGAMTNLVCVMNLNGETNKENIAAT